MTERPPIEPQCEWPMTVAVEELTGYELEAIEKHYGKKFEDIGGTTLMQATVWAFHSRAAGKPASWAAVKSMTMREWAGYFQPEPDDIDPDDPESELGKESATGA